MLGNRFTALLAKRRNWVIPYVIFMMIFVIAPLFLIVYYAFTDAGGAFSTVNFRKFMSSTPCQAFYLAAESFSSASSFVTTKKKSLPWLDS